MAQPVADGNASAFKIYIDNADDEGREAHTAEVIVSATDAYDTVGGAATITWDNLVGVTVAASSSGVTFTAS
jgi:hypothetical protein